MTPSPYMIITITKEEVIFRTCRERGVFVGMDGQISFRFFWGHFTFNRCDNMPHTRLHQEEVQGKYGGLNHVDDSVSGMVHYSKHQAWSDFSIDFVQTKTTS